LPNVSIASDIDFALICLDEDFSSDNKFSEKLILKKLKIQLIFTQIVVSINLIACYVVLSERKNIFLIAK
jgi:hypothetical protein